MVEVGGERGNLVAGDDGWVSDESSLYGDEEKYTKDDIPSFDKCHSFWGIQPWLPSSIAFANRKLTHDSTSKTTSSTPANIHDNDKGKARLFYPYEGRPAHRQSHESTTDFLARLPPSTSSIELAGPWIWVDNPHISNRGYRPDTEALVEAGQEHIAAYRKTEAAIRHDLDGKSESAIGRKLAPHRRALEEAFKNEAIKSKVISGKWMLFPRPEDVDRFWRIVCDGVTSGRLGTAAKVAATGTERDDAYRLICVYTKDFSDVVDVKRVLDALIELKLVDPEVGNGIYYKCDAYTYLGIESKNDFKIKASLYGSKEMLKTAKVEAGSGVKRKR